LLSSMNLKPGTIILLNGTSSSGKTTLLRLLQDRLAEPYLEAGIDKFIWMLPKGPARTARWGRPGRSSRSFTATWPTTWRSIRPS